MTDKNSQSQQILESNPALKSLDVLAGEWDVEASLPLEPLAVVRGHTSFKWLEGGAFLLYHSQVGRAEFPRATAIIGPDDAAGTYSMLYFDSRGVSRIYEMSLGNGTWKLWREFPGFSQSLIGRFSDDRNTITATWEKSSDGSNWELDFGLTYKRVK